MTLIAPGLTRAPARPPSPIEAVPYLAAGSVAGSAHRIRPAKRRPRRGPASPKYLPRPCGLPTLPTLAAAAPPTSAISTTPPPATSSTARRRPRPAPPRAVWGLCPLSRTGRALAPLAPRPRPNIATSAPLAGAQEAEPLQDVGPVALGASPWPAFRARWRGALPFVRPALRGPCRPARWLAARSRPSGLAASNSRPPLGCSTPPAPREDPRGSPRSHHPGFPSPLPSSLARAPSPSAGARLFRGGPAIERPAGGAGCAAAPSAASAGAAAAPVAALSQVRALPPRACASPGPHHHARRSPRAACPLRPSARSSRDVVSGGGSLHCRPPRRLRGPGARSRASALRPTAGALPRDNRLSPARGPLRWPRPGPGKPGLFAGGRGPQARTTTERNPR